MSKLINFSQGSHIEFCAIENKAVRGIHLQSLERHELYGIFTNSNVGWISIIAIASDSTFNNLIKYNKYKKKKNTIILWNST